MGASRKPAPSALTAPWCLAFSGENRTRTDRPVDHRSFRDQLVFSIGFAVTRSRALLRRLLTEHACDDARQMLAERVLEHLEQSGFEIDEAGEALRRKPRSPLHQTPGE
jgi:hypothetical protein